jgi:DNA-binding transcriptional ArsR family regulator
MGCDAWFDVVLDWSGPGQGLSLLMAGAQIAIAALLLLRARMLPAHETRPRQVTVRDVEVATDPGRQRLLSRLENDAATLEELAAATDGARDEIAAALSDLAGLGYVREGRDGRWRAVPVDLRKPDFVQLPAADRARVKAWYDAKLENELSLFRRAFRHPERFGLWSQASRSTVLLSQEEMAGFAEEYMELLNRYSALRERARDAARPGEEPSRPMLVRFYAFPRDLVE